MIDDLIKCNSQNNLWFSHKQKLACNSLLVIISVKEKNSFRAASEHYGDYQRNGIQLEKSLGNRKLLVKDQKIRN